MDATNVDVDGERAMWMAVLWQAVNDATRTVLPRHWRSNRGQGGCTRMEQDDARAFLSDPARLGPVCELLDIDPSWFWQHVQKQLALLPKVPGPRPTEETWSLRWEVAWLQIP